LSICYLSSVIFHRGLVLVVSKADEIEDRLIDFGVSRGSLRRSDALIGGAISD